MFFPLSKVNAAVYSSHIRGSIYRGWVISRTIHFLSFGGTDGGFMVAIRLLEKTMQRHVRKYA